MGQYYIDNGLGHKIELEEAYRILDKAQELGLITQPASSQKPFTMCNCCVDCCGFLRAVSKHPKPAELVFTNYRVMVERDKCSGCGICLKRCQMGTIKAGVDSRSETNLDRCIGCGLCVATCPQKARRVVPIAEREHRVPPADTAGQFTEMAEKRGLKEIQPSQVVSYGFEDQPCEKT